MLSVAYLLFWYQVLTCVSVRLRAAARSMRSCTLRYFCRSKLLSSWLSWWSVKAVRALRGFFVRTGGLSLLLEISRSPSSLVPKQRTCRSTRAMQGLRNNLSGCLQQRYSVKHMEGCVCCKPDKLSPTYSDTSSNSGSKEQ